MDKGNALVKLGQPNVVPSRDLMVDLSMMSFIPRKKTQTLWNRSNSEFDLFALLLINYLQLTSTSQPVIPIT